MTLRELIAKHAREKAAKLAERNGKAQELVDLLALDADKRTEDHEAKVAEVRGAKVALDTEVNTIEARIADLEAEAASDDAADAKTRETHQTEDRKQAYDEAARLGQEKRAYNPDVDKDGQVFLRDVALQFIHGGIAAESTERLLKHMTEERVERGQYLERAAGTGAFAGLTVPQYLTDMYAPATAAMRPLADACNHHELPAQGMTVNISKITTATSVALQASENSAVSETDIDDTLLSINVLTAAGQQTLSRQAIDRGTGVEGVVMDDLFRRYHTSLDSTLINQATTGLSAVANAVAYTDASPTVAELYPLFAKSLSALETAMLDQASGENIAVMTSARWYWLQNAIASTWPSMSQPGIVPQMLGTNFATKYGNGIRGILPNGTPAIVDNNIPTNLGAGTNQDEIYVLDKNECHLWEDPAAPLFIRAEQTKAATLGVLFVLYGYFAYTFARYPSGPQKIGGTGLVTPAFTGV